MRPTTRSRSGLRPASAGSPRAWRSCAFGARRGSNWTGTPTSGEYSQIGNGTRHGYTGHEHLDNIGIIHMNGRVYDPVLGRFLAADQVVRDVGASQAWNGYGYVEGRPLTWTDPTGWVARRGMTLVAWINGFDSPAENVLPEVVVTGAKEFGDLTPPTDWGAVVAAMQAYARGHPGGGRNVEFGEGASGEGQSNADKKDPEKEPKEEDNDLECSLVAPGGDYATGPGASAQFQPEMANALTGAFNDLNSTGIVPTINSGYRSGADQARMLNGAAGPNPAASVSWHQVGMAVDINGTRGPDFAAIVRSMEGQGLTWGGTFARPDPTHFQLAPPGTHPSADLVTACGE